MLVESLTDEVKRRDAALKIIKSRLQKYGREGVYDLTGLSGGFPIKDLDKNLLETYAGPAVFDEALQTLGKIHLGGEQVLAVNRTSAGILAVIMALVDEGDEVVHYLPKSPAHPSIPRSVELVGASYIEFESIDEFKVSDDTTIVFITGSTMDHDIILMEDFLKIVESCKSKKIPVVVDDASGARLRTVVYKQPRAIDMGADITITSTDKLMDGPRGGLMSGREDLMMLVKTKAHQFGLEAQPPLIAGMVRALENLTPERILQSFERKKLLKDVLKLDFNHMEETPTGLMLTPESLKLELEERKTETDITPRELAFLYSMLLLKNHGIITIPAVGMPGASATIRVDLASKDAERIGIDEIADSFRESISELILIIQDHELCKSILFN